MSPLLACWKLVGGRIAFSVASKFILSVFCSIWISVAIESRTCLRTVSPKQTIIFKLCLFFLYLNCSVTPSGAYSFPLWAQVASDVRWVIWTRWFLMFLFPPLSLLLQCKKTRYLFRFFSKYFIGIFIFKSKTSVVFFQIKTDTWKAILNCSWIK